MHEEGEELLDKDLAKALHRIAGLMLLNDSILPRELTTVKEGPGSQRVWKKNVKTTTGELYDLLKAESDAMGLYFKLLQPTAMAQSILEASLQRFRDSPFGRAHPNVGIGATVTELRKTIANDYRILGGTKAQLKALAGKVEPGVVEPPSRKRTNGWPSDRPFDPGFSPACNRGDAASLRRPELGFLSIPRGVVVALTEVGLAWGAIDFWGSSSDIMHFDCRTVPGKKGCP